MEAWFGYVIKMSEIVYSVKLREYESACLSLVYASTAFAASAVSDSDHQACRARGYAEGFHCCDDTEGISASPAAARVMRAQLPVSSGTPGGGLLSSIDGTALQAPLHVSSAEFHAPLHSPSAPYGNSAGGNVCSESSTTASQNAASLGHNRSVTQSETPSSHSGLLVSFGKGDSRASTLAPDSALSYPESVGALFQVLQLKKSMRAIASGIRQLDDIQAEADCVFHELEDVFMLREGDVAAVSKARAGVDAPSSLHAPPGICFEHVGGVGEHDTTSAYSRLLLPSSSTVDNASERHLLYGELTSVGIRQLQAICIASSCMVREENKTWCLPSRELDDGGVTFSAPSSISTGGALGVFTTSTFPSSFSASGNANLPLPQACDGGGHDGNQTSKGAVIVAVDVGSGNGRLLFELSRLAAAACCRMHDSLYPHGKDVGPTYASEAPPYRTCPVPLHSTPQASCNTATASTNTKGNLHRNLLQAAYAPLGVACPVAVWRGWLGVGIEIVPSRMHIARKALAPHYLDLEQALRASACREGAWGAVPKLDSCLSEAIAHDPDCVFSTASAALPSGSISHHVAVRSPTASPTSTGISMSTVSGVRVPQKAARVLLYEGDCLAPGVLTNATLCRFPKIAFGEENLLLHESYPAHSPSGEACGRGGLQTAVATGLVSLSSEADSDCAANRPAAGPHHYRLCRIEGGPSLSQGEDPHLVVFFCGLGFDEAQVRQLCQRLEDMLLCRSTQSVVTAASSVASDPVIHQGCDSKKCCAVPGDTHRTHISRDQCCEDVEASESRAGCALLSAPLSNATSKEDIDTPLGVQSSVPVIESLATDIATDIGGDHASHRCWRSVTCVLLLRPIDVLQQSFPLFRYARRIYDTQHCPVVAEDTASLLSTGCRADGSRVHFTTRAPPESEPEPGARASRDMLESDVWTTVLETTWMSAAPAWVVRFRF